MTTYIIGVEYKNRFTILKEVTNIAMACALAKMYKKSCNKVDIKIKKKLDK